MCGVLENGERDESVIGKTPGLVSGSVVTRLYCCEVSDDETALTYL
jgi:hypothetical protein